MTATHDNHTKSGMLRTFVTCQRIVCGHCGAPATHGAALVDSRNDYAEDDYPVYEAKLFCGEHAARDWYRWPELTAVTAIEFGRSRITIGDI